MCTIKDLTCASSNCDESRGGSGCIDGGSDNRAGEKGDGNFENDIICEQNLCVRSERPGLNNPKKTPRTYDISFSWKNPNCPNPVHLQIIVPHDASGGQTGACLRPNEGKTL
jgi:hypothetical protein